MRRVVVVCEGQTEEAFISRVLFPTFAEAGLQLQGITVETSPGHKGGAMRYDRLRPAVQNALANGRVTAVTTLIDLYKLATDFPGYSNAMAKPNLSGQLSALETSLHADIVERCGCNPVRFIPYIQPHEFEALLFSDVTTLTAVEVGWLAAHDGLVQVRDSVSSPEHINNGHTTKPSARLESLLRGPGYRKLRHGPIAAERIGLAKIEAECHHFAGWLRKLRAL
jgi:Domain of unknown function (DUF4276)